MKKLLTAHILCGTLLLSVSSFALGASNIEEHKQAAFKRVGFHPMLSKEEANFLFGSGFSKKTVDFLVKAISIEDSTSEELRFLWESKLPTKEIEEAIQAVAAKDPINPIKFIEKAMTPSA